MNTSTASFFCSFRACCGVLGEPSKWSFCFTFTFPSAECVTAAATWTAFDLIHHLDFCSLSSSAVIHGSGLTPSAARTVSWLAKRSRSSKLRVDRADFTRRAERWRCCLFNCSSTAGRLGCTQLRPSILGGIPTISDGRDVGRADTGRKGATDAELGRKLEGACGTRVVPAVAGRSTDPRCPYIRSEGDCGTRIVPVAVAGRPADPRSSGTRCMSSNTSASSS